MWELLGICKEEGTDMGICMALLAVACIGFGVIGVVCIDRL